MGTFDGWQFMSLQDAYSKYLNPLEEELRSTVELYAPSLDGYLAILTYHMGWSDKHGKPIQREGGGKRIRPVLCLMACEASGGDWEQALPIAAAIELVHNFSLIHDDIQDGGELRHGRPAVWRVWGTALGINAGDALFTIAHLAAMRLAERGVSPDTALVALRMLDETCLRLTLGQHLDINFEKQGDVDVEMYIQMIEGKSASLLATSVQSGAIVAGVSGQRLEHYRLFGLNLGLAFQVIDDVLGIWDHKGKTGKSQESDLQAKKKTLPVLYGLERSAEMRQLFAGPGPLDGDGVTRAVALLDEVGARVGAEEVASKYSEQALTHLRASQPQGQAAQWLYAITESLLARDH